MCSFEDLTRCLLIIKEALVKRSYKHKTLRAQTFRLSHECVALHTLFSADPFLWNPLAVHEQLTTYAYYTIYNTNMEPRIRTFKSRREIVALLKSYMEEHRFNSNSLSIAAKIPQPTVYRSLIPDSGRVNKTHIKLCDYACINPYSEQEVTPESSQVLMSVLREVWDGTERHARALARLLRSARDVQDRTIAAPGSTEGPDRHQQQLSQPTGVKTASSIE